MERMTRIVFIGLSLVAGMAALPAVGAPHVAVGVNIGYPGYWHGGYWRGSGYYGRPYWRAGWGVGLGVDLYPYAPYAPYASYPYAYDYPAYVAAAPAPVYYTPPPPRSRAPARPDPRFAGRFGQSAGQTEADLQNCNRWATTRPEAMADAAEFHRKSLACMEGRGYEVK